ncbi:pimeloyl-CoA dehydrogenase small subunit [Sphingomonas sp. Root710]|nr:pimeloyl-CoA dehydrogenase small subunit [Sphingomonas sp. Root710]
MELTLTDEQLMLRDMLAAYLLDNYSFDKRQAILADPLGWRPQIWKAFASELGILGASFPEELGGISGGMIENMVIMTELGKALVIEPYLSTVVIAGGFLKHSDHPASADLITAIIGGEAIFAFAQAEPESRYNLAAVRTAAVKQGSGWVLNGHKAVVIGAPYATHLVVSARTAGAERDRAGISIFIVEKSAKGLTTQDFATVDGNRASEVFFNNVSLAEDALLGPLDNGLPLIERVVDEAILATCAEACGVMQKLLSGTVEFTKQREQFGVPISTFQVLQHRMVDMFMHVEQAEAMTFLASLEMEDAAGRARAVSATKVQVSRACRFIGQNSVQLHGGIGITDELMIGHFFKRATMIENAFGNVDYHLRRYQALGLDTAA